MKCFNTFWTAVVTVLISFSASGQYCTTAPTTTAEGEITNVVLNGETYSISNFTTCPTTAALEDYTATDSTDLIEGSSYTATITISPCGGFALDPGACQGWIDWNQNQVFDASESIGSWTGNIYSSNKTAVFNFTVPNGVSIGATRMRILLRQGYGSANTPPLSPCGTGFTYGSVEDYTIRVSALPSPCANPSSPTATPLSDSTVLLNWSSADSAFYIEYGLNGFTQGAGTIDSVYNDSIVLTGLSSQTSYDYYVRTNCNSSGNGTSSWIGPISFTMPCVVQSMPYLEDFNTWPSACFDTLGGTLWFSEDADSSSAVALINSASPGDYAELSSPAIAISTDALVRFRWSHNKVAWANEKLYLYIREAGSTAWTQIWNVSGGAFNSYGGSQTFPGTFITETVNISSSYVGKSAEFKIVAEAGGYGSNIYVDDFVVDAQPPCGIVTSVAFSNILSTSVDVNFVSAGNKFHIEWGLNGFTQGTGMVDTATSSSHTIQGLTVNNTYDVYLRRDCIAQGQGLSPWVGPFTFSTNCADFSNTYFSNFDTDSVGSLATCWSFVPATAGSQTLVYQPSSGQSIQPYSPPNFLNFNSSTGGILITPEFSTIDQDQKQIEFKARRSFGSFGGATIIIGTMSSPLSPLTFTPVDTLEITTSWSHFSVILDSVLTGHNYVGMKFAPTSLNYAVAIDEFTLSDQPPCLPASGFSVSNLTSNSATISWNALDASSWDIEYGAYGFSPGSGTIDTGLTNTTYSFSGLAANTCLDVYITSTCANGVNVAGPFTFCTLCNAVPVPYSQNFSTWPISCWSEDTGIREWNQYSSSTDDMARADLTYWSSGQNAILTTQPFILNQVVRVRFKWSHISSLDELFFTARIQPNDEWDTLGVWTGANFESPSGVGSSKFVPGTMVDEIFYLDSSTFHNQTVEFKLEAIASNNGASLFVDDFVIESVPPCPEPVNFYEDSIKGLTAVAHWQGTGSKYKIEYGVKGFTQGTGNGILDSTTTPSYHFSGLLPFTCYDYYVRMECGSKGNSAWMGPYEFCTDASCPKPVALKFVSSTLTSAWVTWTTGGAANWDIAIGTSPMLSNATFTSGYTSDSIQLTGLLPSTAYYLWVRDSCAPGDISYWAGPLGFSTDCNTFLLNYEEDFDLWSSPTPLSCWSESQGDQAWESFSFGPGNIAVFKANLYQSGESGELISPNVYISDTSFMRFKWSHTIDINHPNDSLMVLARIINAPAWDTLMVLSQSNFILANALTNKPAATFAEEQIDLPGNYVGNTVELNFYAISGGGSDMFIDDVKIEVAASKVTCAPPTGIVVSNISSSSATIDWASTGSTWELSYGIGLSNASNGTKVIVSNKPYSLSGLSSGTKYDLFVREICSASDTSEWSLSQPFNTICGVKSMPFIEDFSLWSVASNLPCWNLDGGDKKFGPKVTLGNLSISAMADFYNSWEAEDQAVMTTPIVDLAYPAVLTMKWSKDYRFGKNDSLVILSRIAGTTSWDTLSINEGSSFDCNCAGSNPNSPSGYKQDTIQLPLSYVGQMVECAFVAIGEQGYNLFIHDVTIEQDPVLSCIGPNAIAIDSLFCERAVVSWNSTNSTLVSNLVWDVKGFNPAIGGNLISNVASPYAITGLMPGVDYDVYMQDSCSVGLSPLVKLEFTTAESPLPVVMAQHTVLPPTPNFGPVQFDASSSLYGTSYLWDFDDGDTSSLPALTHSYSSIGTYTVTLMVTNGCGVSDTSFNVIVSGIDVLESVILESIELYPNPSTGMVHMKLAGNNNQPLEVSVLNLLGQTFIDEEFNLRDGVFTLNLSQFKSGTYLIVIKRGNYSTTRRVVLQK